MEELIRKANFFDASEDDEEEFREKLNDECFEELSADQLNKIFDVLAEKLKTAKWTSRGEPGANILNYLCQRLRNWTRDLEDDEVAEKVVPHIFKVCEVCIVAGLPSPYVEVHDDLLSAVPSEYLENLTKERMQSIVNLVKAGHYRAFDNDNEADFAKDYASNYLRRYIIQNIEEEKMLEHLPLVVDAADFMIKAMMQGPKDCLHYYEELFDGLKHQCSSHPLELLEPDKLAQYLLAYQDILDSREVVGKKVENMMKDTFQILYHHLRGDDVVKVGPVIAPLAFKLLARQSLRYKKLPWLKVIIKDIVSAFYGINEEDAKEMFKTIDFKETLATLRPFLTTIDLETEDWTTYVEDMLRRGVNFGLRTESDALAFFEIMPELMAWNNKKVFTGLYRLLSDNIELMKIAATTDPGKFFAVIVSISKEAASIFDAANAEKNKDKKEELRKPPKEMMSILRALLDAAKLSLEATQFFSAGPPLFSCSNTTVWRFIEDFLRDNEKKARAALKENKGACLECLRHADSLVKTFKSNEDDDRHEYDIAREVGSTLEKFLKLAGSARVLQLPEVQQFLLGMIVNIMRSANDNQAEVGSRLPETLSWDKVGAWDAFFEAIKFLTAPGSPVEQESCTWPSFLGELLDGLVQEVVKKRSLLHPYLSTVVQVMEYAIDEDFYFNLSGSQMPTIHSFVLLKFAQVLQGECSDGVLTAAIYPLILKAAEVCPTEFVFHQVFTTFRFGSMFKGKAAVAVCAHLEPVFDIADECESTTLLSITAFLRNLATSAPEPMVAHAERITKLLARLYSDPSYVNHALCVVMILPEMAKTKPEIVNPEMITTLIPAAKIPMLCNFALDVLEIAAQNKPALLQPHLKSLSEIAFALPAFAAKIFDMFEYIGSEKNQVEPVMATLEAAVNKLIRAHAVESSHALVVMRRLALISPEPLRRREKAVRTWQQEPALHDYAQHLLDVIADRTLAGVDANVAETAAAVVGVSTRLEETEDRVDVIDHEVHQHSAKIENLEERADETDERLDTVEKDVDEMGTEIEAIDQKTMTNAPKWSRKVSLLLNETGERDWRLLAQRLGYGPDDIRGWAAQHDPCMAVLSEWYASRRAAGATHAVRQALRDMERLDALAVVEEAIDAAAGSVPDEPQEYATPPPVFLSYQWGHQPEAKLLCRHLEMAGYHVWMDVGQMGGGDKLFEAIDRGLRGAEVMIACVTEKYAASENCRRELNLAASVGKPIIPLQMHRMTWPPEGPMGPLLAEYLFIRVFSRSPQPEGAPFWPDERFRELLMQIRLHVAPDFEEVRPPYERWWEPPEELIVVPKREADKVTSGGAKEKKEDEAEGKDPEVFISYQWGRQPQVRKLYSRLTGLGCHCWMDIAQMGGGDSLYDKIDRGIRACKVVIACVTPKYALSANCRKEVSLAHAVSKPIIPLLLEKCDWPPAGPMSMVFTELIYVGLHKNPEEQETWDGPKTEELFSKLRDHSVLPPSADDEVKNSAENAQPKAPALPPVTADTEPARPKSGAARRISGAAGPISATGNRPKSSLTSPKPGTAKSPEPATKPPEPATKPPEPATKSPEPPTKSPEPPTKSLKPPAKSAEPKTAPAGNGAANPSKQSRSCSML